MAASVNEHIEVLDTHQWELLAMPVMGAITAVGSGYWTAEDFRNNGYNHPIVYLNGSAANQYGYNTMHDSWGQINSAFGAGGGFGAGNTAVFCPSLSPSGTLAAGGSTTKIILSTALATSVGENQLADRGDGKGFIVRVIGKSAGGSGKIEERHCIANTSGTTPTIILDEALSFTPAATDGYEFLSGSYLYLGTGALAANQWRRYDCLTAALSSLSTTNLIATVPATGNFLVATDEGYVPHTRKSYEGYLIGTAQYDMLNTLTGGIKGCLLATGSAATTLTGQAASGDAAVLANQYRNYQIRIVEDTAIPTAVGQRRRIISHTAGASPVYTISSGATNWTVTPSATCKFVIENWTDNVLGFMGGTTTMYNYTIANNYTAVNTANQWDTTTWAVKGTTTQTTGAFGWHAFGMVADEINATKSSNIFLFRGATTTYDLFDIAGAATGSWTNALSIVDWTGTNLDTVAASDCIHVAYNPHTQDGRYIYFCTGNSSTTLTYQRSWIRFDSKSRRIEKVAGIPSISGSSGFSAARWAFITLGYLADGTKLAFYNTGTPLSGANYWRLWLTM